MAAKKARLRVTKNRRPGHLRVRQGSQKDCSRLVERKLAACVNLLPTAVESVYRWKGQIESAREFLLIVKTTRKRFAAVQ